jgi:hypothetical protein
MGDRLLVFRTGAPIGERARVVAHGSFVRSPHDTHALKCRLILRERSASDRLGAAH